MTIVQSFDETYLPSRNKSAFTHLALYHPSRGYPDGVFVHVYTLLYTHDEQLVTNIC